MLSCNITQEDAAAGRTTQGSAGSVFNFASTLTRPNNNAFATEWLCRRDTYLNTIRRVAARPQRGHGVRLTDTAFMLHLKLQDMRLYDLDGELFTAMKAEAERQRQHFKENL
jgi:hypothetical protein